MSMIERDPERSAEKGHAAGSAPSEFAINTPTATTAAGEAMDAVAASGMSARSRFIRRGLNSSPAYMFAVLAVLFIVFSVLSPDTFPTQANIKNLIVDTSIFLVMSVGMTYVMVAAGFDLSIGSVLVFAGICAVKTMSWVGGQGYGTALAGLVAAVIGGVAWGLFNGFCVTRLRVPALITTLGIPGRRVGHRQPDDQRQRHRGVPEGHDQAADRRAARASLDRLAVADRGRPDRRRGAALHPFRSAHLRHRLQRRGRPAGRHQRQRAIWSSCTPSAAAWPVWPA